MISPAHSLINKTVQTEIARVLLQREVIKLKKEAQSHTVTHIITFWCGDQYACVVMFDNKSVKSTVVVCNC